MNVIQIQELINKIGEFNKNTALQDYYNNEEVLHSQLEKIEDYFNELNQKLLIQLKEKSDVALLQIFISHIDGNIRNLNSLYHKYRVKLAESNNSNEVYTKAIPIFCEVIDSKLNYLTNLKKDLLSKITFFDYKISADFSIDSDSRNASNQNDESETSGRATFNLSKKESLMLLYILEEVNLLKFENNTQRKNFIEQNFNFTEVRQTESYGKSSPMTGILSEYSKFNSKDKYEVNSNNKTLDKLSKKLITIMEEFEFEKKVK